MQYEIPSIVSDNRIILMGSLDFLDRMINTFPASFEKDEDELIHQAELLTQMLDLQRAIKLYKIKFEVPDAFGPTIYDAEYLEKLPIIEEDKNKSDIAKKMSQLRAKYILNNPTANK